MKQLHKCPKCEQQFVRKQSLQIHLDEPRCPVVLEERKQAQQDATKRRFRPGLMIGGQTLWYPNR